MPACAVPAGVQGICTYPGTGWQLDMAVHPDVVQLYEEHIGPSGIIRKPARIATTLCFVSG